MDIIAIKSDECSGHPKFVPLNIAGEHCELDKKEAQDWVQLAPGIPRIQRLDLEDATTKRKNEEEILC